MPAGPDRAPDAAPSRFRPGKRASPQDRGHRRRPWGTRPRRGVEAEQAEREADQS